MVDAHHAPAALEQLRRYEEENRGFRLTRVLPPAAPLASSAAVAGALVLVGFALAQWRDEFGLDWRAAGIADAGAIRAGEVERAVTALTLHLDVPHLMSNLVFGALFSALLFHSCGGGLGALAMLVAGALGNWVNAWIQASEHRSLGASTAVFGAIGLLAGSEARTRHLLREESARRFAPVGAAVVLLLWLGVSTGVDVAGRPSNVDVMSHVLGLLAGLALGAGLGSLPRARIERRALQLAAAVLAVLVLALSWTVALARA